MKNIRKILGTLIVLSTVLFTMSGCYIPSPLYGTWADNQNNQITFMQDKTYNAYIYSNGTRNHFEGDWTNIDNILIFSLEGGNSINTEWDIRGAILYLSWTSDGQTQFLTLYHTQRQEKK